MAADLFAADAVAAMLELIRHDLALLGIHHDLFSSEAELQAAGAVDRGDGDLARARAWSTRAQLERPKSLDQHDDWEPVELTLFRSTQFGDDQDRPMKKSDGSWTYFGADVAYHLQKAEQADELVNIWGADHAGTVKRIQAAVTALTDGRVDLDVKLVQMVRLLRAGEPVKMSKRSGNFVTLADVVERGRQGRRPLHHADQARRRADGFRLRQGGRGVEGQSGLLRPICPCPDRSLQRKAAEAGRRSACAGGPRRCSTTRNWRWSSWPRSFRACVEAAALAHEPHRIAFYLYDLAAAFHALWNRGNDDPERRFLLENNPQLSRARLELARGIGQIIRNGLGADGRGGRPRRCAEMSRQPRGAGNGPAAVAHRRANSSARAGEAGAPRRLGHSCVAVVAGACSSLGV